MGIEDLNEMMQTCSQTYQQMLNRSDTKQNVVQSTPYVLSTLSSPKVEQQLHSATEMSQRLQGIRDQIKALEGKLDSTKTLLRTASGRISFQEPPQSITALMKSFKHYEEEQWSPE